ncbi:cytochrome P450 [Hypoxylon sp. FL1857]|nr:cytochrome P450 [Hypoxylon sp. FL1857]
MESTLAAPTPGGIAASLTLTNLTRLFGLWLAYRVLLYIYNISPFHPLYRFPGPKLAAMSFWYEAWYDFFQMGRYTHEIQRMHEKYGPIVRINPEELHCNDPAFIDEIYPSVGNRIRDRHAHFLKALAGALEKSTFGTRDHETHRARRAAVSRFFSRQQMLRLEPEVHELAQKLCDKLLLWAGKGPIQIIHPFNCFTADTISQYAYGEKLGFLDQDDWLPNFKAAYEAFSETVYLFRFIPLLRGLVSVSPYLSDYMGDDIALWMRQMNVTIPGYIRKAQQDHAKGRIFTELLESSLPDSEKSIFRLSGEGISLMSAGTETTAELEGENPRALSWVALEKHPYLYGVIWEGIRLSYGVSTRLARIPREEQLRYEKDGYQYIIPKGTPIGMSSYISHHDENIFPNSHEFVPERWINDKGLKNTTLEHYILSFSKGSRQCAGMNLALCELFLVTAALALRVVPRMELYETTLDDIKYDHETMTPKIKKGSQGVRVVVT